MFKLKAIKASHAHHTYWELKWDQMLISTSSGKNAPSANAIR